MFPDIGWTEMMVIAVVLIIVVGPKDLPGMLRTFGRAMSQMRSMAGDFRKQFDEALKEAELDDVKKSVDSVRNLDPRKHVREAMKPMRDIGEDIRSSVNTATKMPSGTVETAKSEPTAQEPAKTAGAQMEPLDKGPAREPGAVEETSKTDSKSNDKPLERTS